MDLSYNPVVQAYIDRYLKYSRYYAKTLGLATYYFPLFEELLDQYDLPLEMKYLALVESHLNPCAVSHAGAAGLWQFTYGTAKLYHLKVNSYVDERYDPYRATEAACRYMNYLYRLFGNWNLVLAAYNAGPQNVVRAIRRAGGKKNYWNIRRFLPRETRGYVPAFIAWSYLLNYARARQLEATPPKASFYNTDTVRILKTVSFDQLSKFLAVPKAVLAFLNPSFKRAVIPGLKAHPYTVRLPRKKALELLERQTAFYAAVKADADKREKVAVAWLAQDQIASERTLRHRIRPGENLNILARRYRVRVSQLKRWNQLRSSRIRSGQILTVYTRGRKTRKAKDGHLYHTIHRGETLSQIAVHYHTRIAKLRMWNGIRGSRIRAGRKIRVR